MHAPEWARRSMVVGGLMTICGGVIAMIGSWGRDVTVHPFVLYAPYVTIGLLLCGGPGARPRHASRA